MSKTEAQIEQERIIIDEEIERLTKKYISAPLKDKTQLMDKIRILNERRNTLSHVLDLMWKEETEKWQIN